MIIALRTNRPSLIKIMDIPIIGSFIMFIFALIPMFILMITDGAFGFSYQDLQTNIIYFIVGVYNFILAFFFGISIWIMILPSWLLFTLIGILKLIGWI
ncbi:hypothetical protein [Gilliamella sp. ESL0441]|uniref:hypothetical protein n=1 Tax=unclassified Gilliamella TaxID=2685620 RepID=UPI001C69DAD1|nr:hypothetical protein [Gilliamella sp. ESL0441]QYN44634.1 hypothetical protein GYM75_07205 [Gilliamella sp. ESL0441]